MKKMAPTKSIASTVESELTRRKKGALISVSRIVHEVRRAFPDADHTEEELAEIVAAEAVRLGYCVALDMKRKREVDVPLTQI